jgi:predicted transcriptional regulator
MDMQTIPLKPERKAQLEAYAELHDQSPEEALDDLLAAQLEWEDEDHEDTVAALLEAEADIKAGRTRPAAEVYEAMRLKHGLQD